MKTASSRAAIIFFVILVSLLGISVQDRATAVKVTASYHRSPYLGISEPTGSAPPDHLAGKREGFKPPGFWVWVAVAVLILRMVLRLPVSASGWKRWMEKRRDKGKISTKR